VADQPGGVGALEANDFALLGDRDRLHRYSQVQFQVAQSQSLAGRQRDPDQAELLETWLLDLERVVAGLDRGKEEVSARARDRLSHFSGTLAQQRNLRVRDDGPRRIDDGAANAAGNGLRETGIWQQANDESACQQSKSSGIQ